MKSKTATYAGFISPDLFPRADIYARLRAGGRARVRERGRIGQPAFGERHLHCIWYDAALRPARLQTDRGEEVIVDDPGAWNMEPGPDFLGAVLRIGPERRRIRGDVEIHLRPSDWTTHGHAADPRYANVRAHVTYHPGAEPASGLPPGAVHIALRDALASNPAFDFEAIDLLAYPAGARETVPPCRTVLAGWPALAHGHLLDAAGEERLRRKAERLAAAIQESNAAQVLYEEVMGALGYKQNKAPFRRLAGLVPFAELQAEAGTDDVKAYAILLGVAGLLPADVRKSWDDETRAFIRALWDIWWKCGGRWERKIMPAAAWRFAGLRPTNHPARRLMAAAHLFTMDVPLHRQLLDVARDNPAGFVDEVVELLEVDTGVYWRRRLSLTGPARAEPVALIGHERTAAIVLNVIVPYLAAVDERALFQQDLLRRLPREADSRLVKQAALNLFGPDHGPKLYHDGLRQQGLIQIYHDFCLNDRSRCAECRLPEMLRRG